MFALIVGISHILPTLPGVVSGNTALTRAGFVPGMPDFVP